MGAGGSITSKVRLRESLLSFTKFDADDLSHMFARSHNILTDIFALNRENFDYLVGSNSIGLENTRDLFNNVFLKPKYSNSAIGEVKDDDIDNTASIDRQNELHRLDILKEFFGDVSRAPPRVKSVDKFEVLCIAALLSTLPDQAKIEYIFDVFDFNAKGYLLKEELMLLILSVVNGVHKIDPSVVLLTISICEKITQYAMDNYTSLENDPNLPPCIRRRELLNFSVNTTNVRGFLEAFQGHVNQVLLASNELWKDKAFPAHYDSIYPSVSSAKAIGLPPPEFVHWIRFNHPKFSISSDEFFLLYSHDHKVTKNAERLNLYDGPGLLGYGGIRPQSLLADKWLQNAIVIAAASYPQDFMKIFVFSNQEANGRYCCQFYEGLSWRLLYCDNRFPCDVNHTPLFMTSLHKEEICVLVLQKAMAKYLGSYGRLALCNQRSDSLSMALRLLTGGHVFTHPMDKYVWSSGRVYDEDVNGMDFIEEEMDNYTYVAFARSENMLTADSTLSNSPIDRFPCGYAYPILAIDVVNEKKYIVFKDSWHKGGMPVPDSSGHTNISIDPFTGHCCTFRILAEDLMKYFDVMILSRYPDIVKSGFHPSNSRKRVQRHPNLWRTECVEHVTRGVNNPAIYMLTVSSTSGLDEGIDVIDGSIHLNYDYSDTSNNQDKSLSSSPLSMEPVEICMTINSEVPWSVSGSVEYKPVTRIAIVPSIETNKLISTLTSNDANFEIVLSSDHCWISHTAKLYPGTYYVFADVSFSISNAVLQQASEHHRSVIHNYPWLDRPYASTADAHPIVFHGSSFYNFSIKPLIEDIPENNIDLSLLSPESSCPYQSKVMPIGIQSQAETASQSLIHILHTIQEQQNILESEFEEFKIDFQGAIIANSKSVSAKNTPSNRSYKYF